MNIIGLWWLVYLYIYKNIPKDFSFSFIIYNACIISMKAWGYLIFNFNCQGHCMYKSMVCRSMSMQLYWPSKVVC